MNILTIEYLCFLLIASFFYWLLPNKYRKYVLLFLSFLFLYSFGLNSFLLTLAYVGFIYLLSNNKKINSFFVIVCCLIPLILSKYIDVVDINIIGISYISFKMISYIVKVRNNKCAYTNFFNYLIFIIFFPTLLSGPIEDPNSFIEQIDINKKFDEEKMEKAIIYIIVGFFMKLAVANRAKMLIDFFYSEPEAYGYLVLISVFLYSIYIYCDFCGYSYITLGTSYMLGFKITENFKHPYLSTSMKEFWNRWHVSLNEWLLHYIYIPLGGNKKGKIRKYINTFITFFVSALWHGMSFGYMAWGLLNAFYVVSEDILKPFISKLGKISNTKLKTIIKRIICFILITISWVFFDRGIVGSIHVFKSIFNRPLVSIADMFERLNNKEFGYFGKGSLIFLILSIMLFFIIEALMNKFDNRYIYYKSKKALIRYAFLLVSILILVFLGYFEASSTANFIYFNF